MGQQDTRRQDTTRQDMRRCSGSLLLIAFSLSFIFFITQARAQVDHIVIAAGTDEDKALQTISNEQDPQKKLAMYQEFVQKFSSNPAAVAYGNWQISQAYQGTGDLDKALDYGDKALAGSPRDLDILVSQVSLAQQAKNNSKLMDYAAKGGELCQSISKQPKPDGMSDEEFARHIADEKASAQNNCDFMETSGFNAIAAETDPKLRMAEIEKYSAAFPDSKFSEQVSNYAMYTLGPGQLNDPARLVTFGEKTLASNPNSLPALLLLANHYAEANNSAKSVPYAQKAIEVAKADAPDADKGRKLSAGAAHNIIGWADFKQGKTEAAITEFKAASALLKGQDDGQYASSMYGLGSVYGKLNKLTEAREALTEAAKISGPLQKMSQDLLTKVNAARAK
jgi:tetratricopeptide (TPR) repeat protein